MSEIKKTGREIGTDAQEARRNADGEDLSDKLANTGDEIRKNLENAGDDIQDAADDAKDKIGHDSSNAS